MYFRFCQLYPMDRLTILEKWLKKSRFREITITMTPAAKIRFVKNRIEDKVAISPKGPIVFGISNIYSQTFNIFSDEQYSILLKLEEEGYIKSLVPVAKYKVKFEMTGKPLDPFGITAMNAANGKMPAKNDKYATLSEQLDEIGKMFGGWRKGLEKKTPLGK